MSKIIRLKPASQRVKLRNSMRTNADSEIVYRVNRLIEQVDDLEKDLASANKMIKLLTLLLVSETDGALASIPKDREQA